MAQFFPASLENLIDRFASLPGVGRKSAQRLAFYILSLSDDEAEAFSSSILEARSRIHTCPVCQNLTENELCPICSSERRNHKLICVVSTPKDVLSMERSREYNGVYHVLHGVLSPMNHVGPDDIRIRELLQRIQNSEVDEIIMATNPNAEGDATAMYISRLIKPLGVKVTRLGSGVPRGGDLDYADDATLLSALEGRREM